MNVKLSAVVWMADRVMVSSGSGSWLGQCLGQGQSQGQGQS